MQLWTDYEGVTIDGAFSLKKLLLPEGRSAFFSTTNSRGDQAFLRLIECHFDEEEILARWRCVEALGHPNFLKLERYGQLVIDGGTVVYTAFEKVDASLAEVLAQGRLSLSDTFQLAASLISALEMLHIHGFVHEHVAPRNVFAVGEVVKLRSDCIRETPEGEAAVDAKRRDVHDFAVVLLEALTQKQTLDAAAKSELPAPFDQIVQNGMSGAWGLAEMNAALETGRRPSRSSSATASPSTRKAVLPAGTTAAPRAGTVAGPVEGQVLSPEKPEGAETRPRPAMHSPAREHRAKEDRRQEVSLRARWIGVTAFVAMLALLTVWLFGHAGSGHRNSAGQDTSTSSAKPAQAAESSARRPVRTSLSAAAIDSRVPPEHAGGARAQWRVIVYTYNHQDEAQKKSATIAQNHPELRPEVFAPHGRAPYLVTIGGVMNRDEAFALVRKSRSSGLPRDTYAQNYSNAKR